jgi:hypothetical protein
MDNRAEFIQFIKDSMGHGDLENFLGQIQDVFSEAESIEHDDVELFANMLANALGMEEVDA